MRIRLIASDLDGTLLTDKKELSGKTREVLDQVISQGIHFVPATGRSFRAVPEMLKTYPGVEYIMTSNGGAIYSVSKKQRIYECLLSGAAVDALLAIHKPKGVVMEVFVEGVPYSEADYVDNPRAYGATEYGAIYVKQTRKPVEDIAAFTAAHREKLDSLAFICKDAVVRQRLRKQIAETVPDIFITSSVPHLLEIGNCCAGKGKTLKQLLKLLNISTEEAMAFGDADNDADMLSAVKYGIAMGNASESCKKAAFYVTDTNEADGVAKGILHVRNIEAV